jgi:hypothetical protein
LCALCVRRRTDFEVTPISPTLAVHDHFSAILLLSIRPTRASRPSDVSVEPTDARKDAGHAPAAAGTQLGGAGQDVRHAGK